MREASSLELAKSSDNPPKFGEAYAVSHTQCATIVLRAQSTAEAGPLSARASRADEGLICFGQSGHVMTTHNKVRDCFLKAWRGLVSM